MLRERVFKLSAETRLKMSLNHADFSGEKHPFFGKHHSNETKAKISKSRAGKCCGNQNHFFGKHHTDETKIKISKAKTGHTINSMEARQKMSIALKGKPKTDEHKAKTISQWHNREWANRQIILQRQGMQIMPNKPETIVRDMLNTHFPNEWQYVGDGKFVIERLNPDFININGKKLIIEVFGDYWHSKADEGIRRKVFGGYGYKLLVLWERDVKNKPNKVLSDIKRFIREVA